MRYILSLIFIFSLNVFGACNNYSSPTTSVGGLNAHDVFVDSSFINASSASQADSLCRSKYHGRLVDKPGYTSYGTFSFYSSNYINPGVYSCMGTGYSQSSPITCPSGQTLDSSCNCVSNSCSWATTPPWYSTSRSESTCNNYEKGITGETATYLYNYSWCAAESKCYARKYYCPIGQDFNDYTKQCFTPSNAPTSNCTAGWYSYTVSSTDQATGESICTLIQQCKNNPKLKVERQVSCGAGPVDDDYPDSNPTAPDPDSTPSANPYKNATSECTAKQNLAKVMCPSPKVFSFSCDPTTGTVTKSECTDPVTPTTNPTNPGDDTKAATTQDIKDLGNNLPQSLKDAFNDFFNDGTMPRLEQLRGHLEAENILSADRNDKLDTLTASTDAGLVLQSETNEKLDAFKSNLEGGSGIPESSYITDEDILPNGTIGTTVEALTDDLGSIQDQFVNAKNIVTGNFTPPSFSSGSCPTVIGPAGISFNPGQIGATLSPYSPIISILVYISIMFITFGSVFKFLSRGLK